MNGCRAANPTASSSCSRSLGKEDALGFRRRPGADSAESAYCAENVGDE
jgi:hypothetical protein